MTYYSNFSIPKNGIKFYTKISYLLEKNKKGKLRVIEVKSARATISAKQIAKDKVLASGERKFGKNAPSGFKNVNIEDLAEGIIVSETHVPLWRLPQ